MLDKLIPILSCIMPIFSYILWAYLCLEFVSFVIAFVKRRVFNV